MRLAVSSFLLALLWAVTVPAQPLPDLTGRVVDDAGILPNSSKDSLNTTLEAHEKKTGNQVVVVTVPGLQGRTIEDFGNRLGRHWGIGEQVRNNGVLLIVAPNDRKVRIEVGYGLEGALTDALAHRIIQNEILPHFREGRMTNGISEGVTAILLAIEGEYEAQESWTPFPDTNWEEILVLAVLAIVIAIIVIDFARNEGFSGSGGGYGHRRHDRDDMFDDDDGHYRRRRSRHRSWSSGGGRSSGGGGFSGGGGSFGGGGSSGSW